ncbi:hypothetical protein BCR44DRAFT_1489624 [Catenaria anguillulae PL171]|uniref:Peptide hydrolase n=1 Tax=Catenaria anguillulae PL171 TaxID=765915 RepID=A0A1Y2H516_9FUNG|nr:hypothetical protein BCR44DRAFT_1489624 [Catenaria anguillulae PL171]
MCSFRVPFVILVLAIALATAMTQAAPADEPPTTSATRLLTTEPARKVIRPLFGHVASVRSGSKTNLTTAWDRLAELTDTYGPRPTGSDALEKSIDWMVEQAKRDGFDVHTEDVKTPFWNRGQEFATLITPTWTTNLAMIGLGFSAPTPPGGIEAPSMSSRIVKNSTVLANGATSLARSCSLTKSGKLTATDPTFATMPRSGRKNMVLCRPHPIRDTVLDAQPSHGQLSTCTHPRRCACSRGCQHCCTHLCPLQRPAAAHQALHGVGNGRNGFRNVVIDIKGTDRVDEVILFGGHIDSWDKGVGAQDDGIGFMVCYSALYLLKSIVNFVPRRTLRVVLFTAEEIGVIGGAAYFAANGKTTKVLSAIESDSGVFTPFGFTLQGKTLTDAVLGEYAAVGQVVREHGGRGWQVKRGYAGADVAPFCQQAVCGSWVSSTGDDVYFRFHHAPADMMDAVDVVDAEETAATIAVYAAALSG